MAVCALNVSVLEECGGGENEVGVVGGVGKEEIVDHGEEIGTRESADHGVAVGGDRAGVGVVDEERVDGRAAAVFRIAFRASSQLSERLAEGAHVHDAGVAGEGRGQREIGALDGLLVPRKSAGG